MFCGSSGDPYRDSPIFLTMRHNNCPAATAARVSHREFRCFDRPLSFVVYTQIHPDFRDARSCAAWMKRVLQISNFWAIKIVCFTAHLQQQPLLHESTDNGENERDCNASTICR